MTREVQRAIDNRPQIPPGPVTEGLLKGLCQSCRVPVPAAKLARTDNYLQTTLALCSPCAARWVEVNGEMGVRVLLGDLPPHLVYDGTTQPEAPAAPAPKKPAPAPAARAPKPPAAKTSPRDEEAQLEADMAEFLASFG